MRARASLRDRRCQPSRVPVERERALELLDREARVAPAVRDLAKARVRVRLDVVVGASLSIFVYRPSASSSSPSRSATSASRTAPSRSGGSTPVARIVLGDAEPAAQLAKELERRDPVARLDPRDVGRGAAGEGELPLAEAGGLACSPGGGRRRPSGRLRVLTFDVASQHSRRALTRSRALGYPAAASHRAREQ